MPTVTTIVRSTLTSSFLDRLRKVTTAAIHKTTGERKQLEIPKFELHDAQSDHAAAYNATHTAQVDPVAFTAPAFAVEGAVHLWAGSPDWGPADNADSAKIISTLVHEYIHVTSHQCKGLQEGFDSQVFDKSVAPAWGDEIVTDLYGYLIYAKLGLGADYKTGYLSNKNPPTKGGIGSATVGAKEGVWLSMMFLLPLFDRQRLTMVKAYFHGTSYAGMPQLTAITDLMKACEGIHAAAPAAYKAPFWGLPASTPERASVAKRIEANNLLALCRVPDTGALPTNVCDDVLGVCIGKGKDVPVPIPLGNLGAPGPSDDFGAPPLPPPL